MQKNLILYFFEIPVFEMEQMSTFDVLFKIYGVKNITYQKSQIFLFFSEALSM